jgi:hypothetical protein
MSFLYRLLSFLNDLSAIFTGNPAKRMVNRAIGRNVVNRLWLR